MKKTLAFVKPEQYEIINYLTSEKHYDDFTAMGFAEQFWNYYESNGWRVGRNPMKDWKAAIRTWELNRKNGTYKQTPGSAGAKPKSYTDAARDFINRGK